jgi:hypothetical protein
MENSCYKTVLFLAVIVNAFANSTVTWAQPGPIKYGARTSCLTELRGGKKSCWGIVINFDDARFAKNVRPDQLTVFEAKHGANLLNLMMWRVSPDRKRLTIKFKRGTGDFGTGNQVAITLYKTAFTVPPRDFPDYVVFVQRTDIN